MLDAIGKAGIHGLQNALTCIYVYTDLRPDLKSALLSCPASLENSETETTMFLTRETSQSFEKEKVHEPVIGFGDERFTGVPRC